VIRLLLDVNVVLDVLIDRRPHATQAARLWAEVERGRARGLLPAHGLTTIHYLARRARGPAFARRAVSDLLSVFGVAPVDAAVLARALALSWSDFEDAVCAAAAAAAAACDAIVTRDPRGFRDPPVPVLDPAAALAMIEGARIATKP
jgi:predicted nucleic acid-binding protein